MATDTSLLSEIRRAAFQWIGVAVAAIASGFVLGELLLRGWKEESAILIAFVVGVVLVVIPLLSIGKSFFRKRSITITMPVMIAAENIGIEAEVYTMASPMQAGEMNAFTSNQAGF